MEHISILLMPSNTLRGIKIHARKKFPSTKNIFLTFEKTKTQRAESAL